MSKKRLDHLLVEKKLVSTRQRAQNLIRAGKVLVDHCSDVKPGQFISPYVDIQIREEDHPYVSRGGLKLDAALQAFHISVEGKVGLDIGASTGGFTQVLLIHQIARVHAIDVGHGQLADKVRQDPRVFLKEKINARYLTFEQIGEKVDIIVIDVSFISLEKILPAILPFAKAQSDWITLIKPQFEVGKEKVSKGGIVTSAKNRAQAIDRLTRVNEEKLGLIRQGLIPSPIAGADGNLEFLAHWKMDSPERFAFSLGTKKDNS